ncbi:hypothetical protein RclHR1_10720003 [Rhizophagus clarus]|uniref:MIR domain-containing protein n=1 Tax=Rhizophagus clarus TaxID=94130 RepID=A0A2Z6Q6W6_9GLOM|nr:hypothetical protein RclHR1_10720003 [Rhizophagus clarus]
MTESKNQLVFAGNLDLDPNALWIISKLDNHQGYLKSNDIINLIIDNLNGRYYDPDRFLCSHDIHFTIGKDAFQEVVCHNKTTRINDEWYIELIKNV